MEWFVFHTFQDLSFSLKFPLRTSFLPEILCSASVAFDKAKELEKFGRYTKW